MILKHWLFTGLLGVLVFAYGCEHVSAPILIPVQKDFSYIAAPIARWQAYELKNYSIEQRVSCFCPPPRGFVRLIIKNNRIISGTDLDTNRALQQLVLERYQTIDEIFERIIFMVAST